MVSLVYNIFLPIFVVYVPYYFSMFPRYDGPVLGRFSFNYVHFKFKNKPFVFGLYLITEGAWRKFWWGGVGGTKHFGEVGWVGQNFGEVGWVGQNTSVKWGAPLWWGGMGAWDKTLWWGGVGGVGGAQLWCGGTKHFGDVGWVGQNTSGSTANTNWLSVWCFVLLWAYLFTLIWAGGKSTREKQIKLSLLHNVLGGRQVHVRKQITYKFETYFFPALIWAGGKSTRENKSDICSKPTFFATRPCSDTTVCVQQRFALFENNALRCSIWAG